MSISRRIDHQARAKVMHGVTDRFGPGDIELLARHAERLEAICPSTVDQFMTNLAIGTANKDSHGIASS
ncbi:hypothetical protein STUTZSP0542_15700 [Stutzerimonas marianensis]